MALHRAGTAVEHSGADDTQATADWLDAIAAMEPGGWVWTAESRPPLVDAAWTEAAKGTSPAGEHQHPHAFATVMAARFAHDYPAHEWQVWARRAEELSFSACVRCPEPRTPVGNGVLPAPAR